MNSWIGYAPMFLAQDLGHMADADVRLIEFPSNTASMLALADGDVEAAALTLDELLLMREGGLDAQVAMVFDESQGADAVLAHPDLPRLNQLKGRRIGAESSAVGALMLSQVLARAQLQASDITLVPLTVDRHAAAFTAREVDAIITFEPIASKLQAQGAHRLLDTRDLPGLVVDVLAIRPDPTRQQTRQLKQLTSGHFRALTHLATAQRDAANRLALQQNVAPHEILKSLEGIHMFDLSANRNWMTGAEPRLVRSANLVGQVMQANRLLVHPPQLANLCWPGALPEAP